MKKFWFLVLLGVAVLACGPTKAKLQEQTVLQSIMDETESQVKIICKIVVKRHGLSDRSYEPIEDSEVIIIKDKTDLPTPADYVVLGSMTVEAEEECKIVEITDAIKSGAGTFGANYVLPMKAESIHNASDMALEKTISTYILLRRENLSI